MKTRGGYYLALPLICVAMLFCWPKISAASPSVIISEVAWMGTASSTNAEWLELFNDTASNIMLDGWTLKARDGQPDIALAGTIAANDYFILERTSDETLPNVTASQIYTGALGNGGEYLELSDATGLVVDSLDASTGWPGGDNTTKTTLERLLDLAWATSTVIGGTPTATNSVQTIIIISPPIEPVASDTPIVNVPSPASQAVNSVPINLPKNINIYPGEIVINELVSDPLDGEDEWVELYLMANKTIDLAGASLEDGSGAKTTLAGVMSPSSRFKIIAKPYGNLNNSGDLVALRDGNKTIVDQVAYGDWAQGQFNASVARDGWSLARRFDGVNTFNVRADWAITKQPTKAAANQIMVEDDEVAAKPINTKSLIINEIMPDPQGDDVLGEFIELYNIGEESLALNGWRLQTKSGQIYKFSTTTVIGAHEIKAFYRATTHLSLINESGSLKLLPPGSDTASQNVSYKKGQAGLSYARDTSGLWQWTFDATPGTMNKFSQRNQAPVVAMYVKTPVEVGENIVFDSSDTVDPEGDALKYAWKFDDGATSSLANPEHAYFKKGNYHVTLTVSDGSNGTTITELIKVMARTTSAVLGAKISAQNSSGLVINEAMPNPVGSDDGEWVELFNSSKEKINLLGWSLDDGPDGSNPHKISEDMNIDPGGYLLFERAETDLALNNNADEIRLFDSSGRLVQSISYQKSSESLSWARTTEGKYAWSEVVTPGAVNVIKILSTKSKTQTKSKIKNQKSKSSESEVGDEAVFQCIVTSLPGQLASQYFYCENDRGWQIYNYKKNFPSIKINDLIEVRGVVSQVNSNWRLKIKDQDSIKKISNKRLEAASVGLEDIGAGHFGKLIKVQGEITKKSGSSVYLDDNTGEAVLQIKASAGLSTTNINIGEIYNVIGVVQSSQSGVRILPRSRDDIKKRRPEVSMGELATGTETWLSAPGRAKGYAVVIGSGTVLLAGLWAMKKMGVRF